MLPLLTSLSSTYSIKIVLIDLELQQGFKDKLISYCFQRRTASAVNGTHSCNL